MKKSKVCLHIKQRYLSPQSHLCVDCGKELTHKEGGAKMKSKSKPIRGRAIKVNTKRQVACFEKDDCLIVQFKRSKPKAYNDKKKLKGFKDLTIQTSKSRMLTTIYLRKDTAEALVHLLVSYLKEEPK